MTHLPLLVVSLFVIPVAGMGVAFLIAVLHQLPRPVAPSRQGAPVRARRAP